MWLARNKNIYKFTTNKASVKYTTQQAAKFSYLAAKYHKCVKRRQLTLKWNPPKDNF